jgi:hypothetical protein
MPTEASHSPEQIIERSKAPSIGPLAIAAVLALALHLVSGIMLDRSHASPGSDPAAFAASDDGAICATEAKQPQPSLPYD